ncbi:MAG: dTMP kinase [Syntrophales bacterium]|nr:dTMP kinase [Syntrophales bacterium]
MGIFITFEGIEGSGKTTQLQRAVRYLRERSLPVLATQEPGGTALGRAVRDLLLNRTSPPIDAAAELLLFCAARAQHVVEVIRPALAAGKIVLCDRFSDATVAYQAYGRGITIDIVREIDHFSTGGLKPHLTILFDVAVATGITRAINRIAGRHVLSLEDRFEHEDRAFHERVRAGYWAEVQREPLRFCVIDAARNEDDVCADVRSALEKTLREAGYVL